jgi:NTE family protein
LRGALERLGGTFDGRLRVTAVDAVSGKRVVFGAPGAPEAGVTEAVLASCSVPWVFRPVTIGGREYVDGGFWSAANLDVAPVERGTRVLCLNPTASPRLGVDRLGAMRAFARGSAAAEALALRRRGAHVEIVAPDAATVEAIGPNLFSARRRPQVEAAGYAHGRALAAAT